MAMHRLQIIQDSVCYRPCFMLGSILFALSTLWVPGHLKLSI